MKNSFLRIMARCFGILLFLSVFRGFAAANFAFPVDSARRIFHVDDNAALIVNRSFSHFEEKNPDYGHASAFLRLSGLPSPQYLPGFQVGISPVLLVGRRSQLIFDVAFSCTQATYRREQSEMFRSTPPNIYTTLYYDETARLVFSYLNFGIGWGWSIAGPLSVQASVLAGANLGIHETRQGTLRTTEQEYFAMQPPPGSPPPHHAERTEATSATMRYQGDGQVSARLSLYYRLATNSKFQTELFLYRNFAAGFSLPWWGDGASVRVW